MSSTNDLASIAALVGEPSRAAMLVARMDGRAHTATEFALHAGVTPSTASSLSTRLRGMVNNGCRDPALVLDLERPTHVTLS